MTCVKNTSDKTSPPILTHFSIAWSVCLSVVRLSVTFVHLLKLFDGFRYHVAGRHVGPVAHCVRWPGPWPTAEGTIWGRTLNQHAIASCSHSVSPVLPPGEYKRGVELTCLINSTFYQITLVLVLFAFNFSGGAGLQNTPWQRMILVSVTSKRITDTM